MHDGAGARVHECFAVLSPVAMRAARDLEQGLRAVDIDLVQEWLVSLQHRRRRGVDDYVGLDGAENAQHGLDGSDVAIVVLCPRQAIVCRAEVNHCDFGLVRRVPTAQVGVVEARVVSGNWQGCAGVGLGGEVQELVHDVPPKEAAATDD